MPLVTFTVLRGLSAADKSRLSEAMMEAQVAAGYHRADRFHRFLEVGQDDLLVDLRFPNYATDRTDRFMVVEVVISSGRPAETAATIADAAVRLFGERLHLAPQDILFVFHEVKPNLPRFPAASISREANGYASPKGEIMHILNIVTSPRKEQSASRALVDAFLREYMTRAENVTVDILDVWQESLPEFDAETINAKYKGVSGEPMTPSELTAWQKIRELASRFQRADRIVMGVPMWNFSFPYKLKQLIDLSCQRNMLFTFDGKRYGPSLDIEKAFVAFVRGQSDEAGFDTVSQPGFQYLSGYVEFWLRFIGVREVVTLTLEHTWDGRAVDMIDAGKKKAAELAMQF